MFLEFMIEIGIVPILQNEIYLLLYVTVEQMIPICLPSIQAEVIVAHGYETFSIGVNFTSILYTLLFFGSIVGTILKISGISLYWIIRYVIPGISSIN